jgi:hypothetical protein
MAIATTIVQDAQGVVFSGTVNLTFADTTGISSATPLTVSGSQGDPIVVTPIHPLPNNAWKCEVTTEPRGHGHTLIQKGEAVTG